MVAVIQEQFEIADLLIKHGLADQNYQNIEGLTIQDKALYMNKSRVLHYLDGRLPASNSIKTRTKRQSGSMEINGAPNKNAPKNAQNKSQILAPVKNFNSRNMSQPNISNNEKSDIF